MRRKCLSIKGVGALPSRNCQECGTRFQVQKLNSVGGLLTLRKEKEERKGNAQTTIPGIGISICFPLSRVSPLALDASSHWDEGSCAVSGSSHAGYRTISSADSSARSQPGDRAGIFIDKSVAQPPGNGEDSDRNRLNHDHVT